MNKRRKHSDITSGNIIAAVIIGILLAFLIVFAMFYDPDKQFSNSFFEDVSNAVQWR